MKLYSIDMSSGHPGSHNALKVSILLNELGISYELVELDPATELQPAEADYRRLNPNGLTPTLDDNGFLLWESGAILQYLCDCHGGGGLLPRTGKLRALTLQWLGWEASTLTPSLMAFFIAATAENCDEEGLVSCRQRLLKNLDILNVQLAGQEWVTGTYSIADIALGCNVAAAFMLQFDLGSFPELLQWLGRLRLRPEWQEPVFLRDLEMGIAQGQLPDS
ncbi:MAG: glutathione S-transferase family protein [Gammaproteobacteria bacterium]|nr:glutathione S-transferase family protein [Gammaproteobacteria bacterium]